MENEKMINDYETEANNEYFGDGGDADLLDELAADSNAVDSDSGEGDVDISQLDAETKEKLGVEDEETEEAEPEDESE